MAQLATRISASAVRIVIILDAVTHICELLRNCVLESMAFLSSKIRNGANGVEAWLSETGGLVPLRSSLKLTLPLPSLVQEASGVIDLHTSFGRILEQPLGIG